MAKKKVAYEKIDKARDKKAGIKENSARDMPMDAAAMRKMMKKRGK